MRLNSAISLVSKITKFILLLGTLISIFWSLYFSIIIIITPYQIDMREGASQVLTGFFLRGENPFISKAQPLAMNNFGMGYNLIVFPFAIVFGNTLLVHRLVTFIFIVLSGLISSWVVYIKRKDVVGSLACMAFVLLALVAHGGIGAFPSSMGTFLFLATLLLPFLRSFDKTSLLISAVIALLAFYTKPYFLLAFGIVFSYLFLFVSKKRSSQYGLFFAGMFIVFFLLCNYLFPFYFINVFVSNWSNADMSLERSVVQLIILFYFFIPVIVIVIMASVKRIFANGLRMGERTMSKKYFLNVTIWQFPLFSRSIDFLMYSFGISFLVFALVLGQHAGNFMNYAYQLLIPLFFIYFFREIFYYLRMRFVSYILIFINLFVWTWQVQTPAMLSQRNSQDWAEVFAYVYSSHSLLNSPVVASEISALGLLPVDSGQTSYYYAVKPYFGGILVDMTYEEYYRNGDQYVLLVEESIKKKKYDLVITTEGEPSFYDEKILPEYYSHIEEIEVDMPQTGQHWTLVIWKPLVR